MHPRLSNPTTTQQQLTLDQLRYLQQKLQTAWFKALDAETTARTYIPTSAWSYSTHSCYYEYEQIRTYECLAIVNRQITARHQALLNTTQGVTD